MNYTYSCNNYICPNTDKCVDNLRKCIPFENQRQKENEKEKKPFRCNQNSNKCVKSMTECDPPEGMRKCPYMKALYPLSKEYLISYLGITK